ncbi:S-DNA-T family DNA segregation ATPase FtsK/SpoIIIE [Branchiibius hedensis]|uniref:DNA segregation ATPase FtsK/SpoIIIE, S-DNA-T family n=1 Tax=Branchiibius hedensis TaxID=672460 RepID=A0A2Y8ZL95_9MICO|nr:FtsK/SpoIIIE domain-containing protein [Branchiibius hedensis]PWJ24384.1 S-DNA-T family DNA segregation ATPase FtsK/SpoIIIE [Branchiibius hedensis]SSA33201.1 DNA segregation ATPase FtsK/SpoIIIE, S-DNA-T family [Branchiibius hedensis]
MTTVRLTICEGARSRDVVVRAPAGTTWAEVIAANPTLPQGLFAGARPIAATDVVGSHPLVHAAVLSSTPAAAVTRHLLELHVIEGPGAGAWVPLGPTSVTVGRARSAVLQVPDPGVSRHHLTVGLDSGRVVVTAHDATNGTLVDGQPLAPATERELTLGNRIGIGNSVLELVRRDGVPTMTWPEPPPQVQIRMPAAPQPPEKRPWPLAMALLPLVVAGGAALLLHNPMFLMFAVLSPVMLLSQYVTDRRGGSRSHRRAMAAHRDDVEVAEAQVRRALEQEIAVRRSRTPALGTTVWVARSGAAARWSRDPTAELRLRLGTGVVESGVTRRWQRHTFGDDDIEPVALQQAPVEIDLRTAGRVELAGPQRQLVAQSLLTQLATWFSPDELQIVVCASPVNRPAWQWLRFLPHVLPAPDATPRIGPTCADTAADTTVVLVTDEVAANAPADAVVIALVADSTPQPGRIVTTAQGRVDGLDITLDLPAPGQAETAVRALAAATGSQRSSVGLPREVSLVDLAREYRTLDPTHPDAVLRAWSEASDRVLLGRTAEGPWEVSLPVDGPHALIAGTTGAGKSGLLQTFLVSWALSRSPQELSYVLIDYKGGAAFSGCAGLPHTVGMVTDLDASLTVRALRSLQAEIRRREQLLASAGAVDYAAYRDNGGGLARLVLVIDEFRVLADELPDFVHGLVRLAAVGRSMGIHLILATQRPAGVVSADIRANMDLRIALRLNDVTDSRDVIDADDAARLDPSRPGRAVAQRAGGDRQRVQVARVSGHTPRLDAAPEVLSVDPQTGAPISRRAREDDDDLSRIVSAIRRAHALEGSAPAHRPWLPPLAARLTAESGGAGTAPLGLVDLPDEQRQEWTGWSLKDGNLLIVGGPASGRSTVLRTLATGSRESVYWLTASKPTVGESLPHIGAVIRFDEHARVHRLLTWLEDRIAHGGADPVRLLIDDWDSLQARTDALSLTLSDRLLAILRDGPRAGVVTAVAGGRGVVSGRVSGLAARRLCLTSGGTDDVILLGVKPAQLPSLGTPGRGLLLPEELEIQCALPGAPAPDASVAVRFDPLPAQVDSLPAGAFGVGLDGPIGWRDDDRAILIAGPPGSGRSTALAASAAADPGRTFWLTDPAQTTDLTRWAGEHPGGTVYVDDADQLGGTPIEGLLADLAGRHRLVVTSSLTSATAAFTGLLPLVKRAGVGVILQPGPRDGEVLGVSLPTSYDEGPGSGVVVHRGRLTQVRVSRAACRTTGCPPATAAG